MCYLHIWYIFGCAWGFSLRGSYQDLHLLLSVYLHANTAQTITLRRMGAPKQHDQNNSGMGSNTILLRLLSQNMDSKNNTRLSRQKGHPKTRSLVYGTPIAHICTFQQATRESRNARSSRCRLSVGRSAVGWRHLSSTVHALGP